MYVADPQQLLTPRHTVRRDEATPRAGIPARRPTERLAFTRLVAMLVASAAFVVVPAGAAAPDAPPMEPQDAIAAFSRVESWVRAGAVESVRDGDAPEPFSAAVTLSIPQRVVAEASAHAEEPETDPGAVLTRAASRAIAEAGAELRALGYDPVPWDAVAVSLELGGRPVPIDALQIAEASLLISPGTEGVAARLGDRLALGFPGPMLRRSREPGPVLASLVVELSGDGAHALTPLPELRELGFDLYRFGTLHLAQGAPGTAPAFLFRGGRVVPASDLNRGGLERFARGMAAHLKGRRWPGVEPFGMTGTYDAGRGAFQQPFADPGQQAIAALALARLGSVLGEPGMRAEATAILVALAEVAESETAPWSDPLASAVTIIALTELGVPDAPTISEHDEALTRQLREACVARLEASAGLARQNSAVALAMHRLGDERGAEGIRTILRTTPPEGLPGQMPWLVWGAREIGTDQRVPGDVALRRMRTLVWDHQIRAADTDEHTRDLNGGIVFTDSPNPLPTWQAARPLAGIAAMLGDPRLTERRASDQDAGEGARGAVAGPSEHHAELARLIASLRFLRQLAADPSNGAIHARSARRQWGIRLAPWDQRMPLGATALTLLAVAETLDALDTFTR